MGADQLEVGDTIVAVDGTTIGTIEDLEGVLADKRPGDSVSITVDREGAGEVELDVTLTESPSEPGKAIIGFIPFEMIKAQLPFKIRFNLENVGGPSAGLAFALEVLEQRGRDVDHGLRVAATGEIELDGSVKSIGGVKQKTIGARKAHVDVFLVPADGDNARDAKRYAKGLRIIPVKSFQQALHALATLPPKT